MGTYGPNFEFRATPEGRERQGRFVLDHGDDTLPIGAPVVTTGDQSDLLTGALKVDLAAANAARPLPGQGGIAVYEWIDYNGLDPVLSGPESRSVVPDGQMLQVVRGEGVKVVFRNTTAHTFLQSRSYTGRMMVAGAGATPTVAIGDLLTPGVGDDDNGYWKETTDPDEAWLVVESVDTDRGEVEARLLF